MSSPFYLTSTNRSSCKVVKVIQTWVGNQKLTHRFKNLSQVRSKNSSKEFLRKSTKEWALRWFQPDVTDLVDILRTNTRSNQETTFVIRTSLTSKKSWVKDRCSFKPLYQNTFSNSLLHVFWIVKESIRLVEGRKIIRWDKELEVVLVS